MNCIICKLISEEYRLIKETKYSFCTVNYQNLNDGHVMVIPKRHVEELADLNPEESADLIELAGFMKIKLNKMFKDDSLMVMNTGRHASQKHIHLHILPSKGGLRELVAKYENIPERTKSSKEELERIKHFIIKNI